MSPAQIGSFARRADGKDAAKKKPVESSDDWRRGMQSLFFFVSRVDISQQRLNQGRVAMTVSKPLLQCSRCFRLNDISRL